VEDEFLHADGQTDRHDETNSRFFAIRVRPSPQKKICKNKMTLNYINLILHIFSALNTLIYLGHAAGGAVG